MNYKFREIFKDTVLSSVQWFENRSTEKNRLMYDEKGKLTDKGNGAVYVYIKEGKPLYVGETSRPIKRRMHDVTSPHKKKAWWETWDTVKFINLTDKTDRLTLELLLIIGLKPTENIEPAARDINRMFDLDQQ